MSRKNCCEECECELPANAPEGLCPRCLAAMAISLIGADASPLSARDEFPNLKSDTGSSRWFGDYELLEEIARGGMGVVYQARQVSLNRIVAVKMLLFGEFSSDEFVQRFQAEAKAVASLHHPNIVAIHEVGEYEGRHYFSMDYVEGKNLAEVVREKPLPAKRAALYIKTIADAVHHAHQRGIVHRDLKPSNVLIDKSDQPRVTDFGLARRLASNSELTKSGQVLGSPNYMPPEQADAGRGTFGIHSDVYSLGAILYHLLTGRPPFLAETLEDTLRQLLNNEPAAPRLLNPSVPRDLETICLKCLHKDPRRRYDSARDLSEDLGRWLAGEPIQARSASPPEKLWRWSRRKPALATVIVLLMAVAVGSTLAAVRFERLRTETEALRATERIQNYVETIRLAGRELEDGDLGQSLDLLKQAVPRPGESDLRGFEWRYLWRQCRGNYFRRLPVHDQIVGAMQFAPNGRLVASHAWDDTLRVWNLETRSNLFTARGVTGFDGFFLDGNVVVVSREDESLQLLQAESGVTNRVIPDAGVLVAAGAKSQSAVTISRDGVLKAWDLTTAQYRFSLPNVSRRKLDSGWGYPYALAPNGNTLAIIERHASPLKSDIAIRLWDLTAQKELPPLPLPADVRIRTLEFSPDGSLLAVGDGDGIVRLWSLDIREKPPLVIKAHEYPVFCLAFAPDGRTLATGSSGPDNIRLWDVATGSPRPGKFSGQVGDVLSLAFSPLGKSLASGTRDGPIRIWNLEEVEVAEVVEEHLHAHAYGNFIFSPDSQWMAGGCADNTVRVWDVATLKLVTILTNATYVVAFSKDGQRVLVSSEGGIPRWRNVMNPAEQKIGPYVGDLENMIAVDLSPSLDVAALGLTSGTIQLWGIKSGQPVGSPWSAHVGSVHSLVIFPGGDKLASGGVDKVVRIWESKTHQLLSESGSTFGHKGSVCAVAVSPSGKTLASGCAAGTIKLWNPNDVLDVPKDSRSLHKAGIRTLAFSPDGRTLASGSEDNTVKLWRLDLSPGRYRLREVASFKHEAHLRLVVFSPDGKTLATVTDRGTLRLFCTATLQEADGDLVGR